MPPCSTYRCFTEGAARLAGAVPAMLGWRPDEFWAATPAEVAAILAPPAATTAPDGVSRAELDRLMETLGDGR